MHVAIFLLCVIVCEMEKHMYTTWGKERSNNRHTKQKKVGQITANNRDH